MLKLLLFLLFVSNSFANDSKEFYKIPYQNDGNKTLLEVLHSLKKNDSTITKKNKAYKRTKMENPDIKDWDNLKSRDEFYLFIKIKDLDKNKYDKYVSGESDQVDQQVNSAEKTVRPSSVRGSLFYMASYGKFTQTKDETNITFYQNSPVSLGTAWSFYPKDSLWSFATSVYGSYLLAAGSNLNGKKVNVPLELGGNFYTEYRFNNLNFTGYFGPDFERFSTFDLKALEDEELKLVKTSVIYATVGFSKLFNVFSSPVFTKLSLSKSVISSTEESSNSKGSYQGYKVMWYLNKKISQDWFIHSLFKYHWMDGPSKLTTTRMGLGFGYIF